jgi:hypothetical protein
MLLDFVHVQQTLETAMALALVLPLVPFLTVAITLPPLPRVLLQLGQLATTTVPAVELPPINAPAMTVGLGMTVLSGAAPLDMPGGMNLLLITSPMPSLSALIEVLAIGQRGNVCVKVVSWVKLARD